MRNELLVRKSIVVPPSKSCPSGRAARSPAWGGAASAPASSGQDKRAGRPWQCARFSVRMSGPSFYSAKGRFIPLRQGRLFPAAVFSLRSFRADAQMCVLQHIRLSRLIGYPPLCTIFPEKSSTFLPGTSSIFSKFPTFFFRIAAFSKIHCRSFSSRRPPWRL